MKKPLNIIALMFFPLLLQAAQIPKVHAPAQGHTLYGDLRVEVKGAGQAAPMSFLLTLYTAAGNIIGRENVPANGRYRFTNVPNGEYDIVIERDNAEVGRMRFLLQEQRFTDIRKDIALQMGGDTAPAAAPKIGSIAPADAYRRAPENGALFEKAVQAVARKDVDGAISLSQKIVAADPQDFEAWAELGTAQFLKGDLDASEKSYTRALDIRPAYFVALLNLGKLRLARKQSDGAVEILAQAVAAQPRSADANYFLGEAYLQVKKGSKAVGYLNEAIKLDPAGMADAHLRLATLYNAANMKERAAAEYEQFLAKKPDHPEKKKLEQYIRDNKKP